MSGFTRVATAAGLALTLLAGSSSLRAASRAGAPEEGATGSPWSGSEGVTETVGQIMARESATRGQRVPAYAELPKVPRSRKGLPQNPLSPPVSQWPPLADESASSRPEPLTPQTSDLGFTGATLFGINPTFAFPPDSMGAAGPTQFVVAVNGRIVSFSKATGQADGALGTTMDLFFASVRGNAATSDPRIRFDRLAGRWFVTIITVSVPNRVLLAVSSGAAISAGSTFTFFSFPNDSVPPAISAGCFADYPSLGVDANALYMGVNEFCGNPLSYTASDAFVIRKSSVLGAGPLVVTAFRNLTGSPAGPGPASPQGVDNFDPAATEGYFIGADNATFGTLMLRRVLNPGTVPSLGPNVPVTVPATRQPIPVQHLGNTLVPQGYLDAIDDRLFAAHVRNGRLFTAQNIGVDNTGGVSGPATRDGVRWYELSGVAPGSQPTLAQAGTLFLASSSNGTDQRSYFIPTIMVSGQGHAALGFSVAGANERVNAGTAGRLASDPPGTLQAPWLLTASSTPYDPVRDAGEAGRRRWGDYSYTSVDPNDDMTFWTVQQFCDDFDSYGVRVARLLAPKPATPASCSPATVTQGSSHLSVTLTGSSSSGTGFFDPGPAFPNRLSATVNGGGITVNGVTYASPTSITLDLSVAPNAVTGARTVTVTNPDGQATTSPAGILTVASGTPATVTATAGTPQSATVNTPYATPLSAAVRNASGLPLAGVSVAFTAPASGPSGSFPGSGINATALTNGGGVATAPAFTAGATVGTFTVTASVPGTDPAIFTLTNVAGPPAVILAASGTPQSTAANTAFPVPLQAAVRDSASNPVSGVQVTFSAPTSGAGGAFATGGSSAVVTTNALGVATAPALTANATAGSFTVTATAAGVPGAASFSLTTTVSPAAAVLATRGTPQTATVSSLFGTALAATVVDSRGGPVPGTTVVFTAPTSGPRATFTGGTSTVTVAASASGVATAPNLTAGTVAGSYTVTASVPGVATPATYSLTNVPGGATTVAATGGTPQSALVGNAFAAPLSATVRDAFGNLVSGVTVTFTAPASGPGAHFPGGAFTATATTDASGVATSPTLTAGGSAGSYTVAATAPGAGTPAVFSLSNTSTAAASISASSGTPQSATVSTAFATPLAATVRDAGGNPVGGIPVAFAAPASGARATFPGGAATASVVTSPSGVATAPGLTAGSVPGSYTVTASVSGVAIPASFALTNNASPPASISTASGTPQSATVNTAFAAPLAATVRDGSGTPLSGLTVTFSAPASGASATFAGGSSTAAATTGAGGVATSPGLFANGSPGTFAVNASVPGLSATAAFILTNRPGGPASIAATGGTPQQAPVNTAFAAPLSATVRDAGGAPVIGAPVTFTAPAFGPRAAFAFGASSATVPTDASGVAASPALTASSAAGSYTVTASVAGVLTPALFALTNAADAPATIVPVAGAPQSVALGGALLLPLSAVVRDSSGNGVPGAAVTFVAPAAGPSGTFGVSATATVSAGAGGVATTPPFTANGLIGGYAVTAAAAGVASPASFALANVAGGGASVTLGSTPNPSTLGQPVTLTAAASGPAGTPTGTVTFQDGSNPLGSAPLAGGSAVLVTSAIQAGSRILTAYHPGDATYAASLSAPLPQTVKTSGGCTSGSNAILCLQNGRFRLQVFWKNPYDGGSTGSGTAIALTNESGYFWFFAPSNVELVIKVLDGRSVNGSFWVMYGALSTVQYTITITDIQTGVVKTYLNAPGNLASVADTGAFAGP